MRPSWEETWMHVADTIAARSFCVRRKAGCVLVSSDNQIVATGYNGPPRGYAARGPCSGWCERATTGGSMSYDDCISVHSEINAFIRADSTKLRGGTAYVTSCPCFACAKALANAGLSRVVCRITDEDIDRMPERSLQLLRDSDIGVFIQRQDGVIVAWS